MPDVGTLANRYLETRKPFAEQLPEKIRGEAAFKDIKDLAGLADSYYNGQKLLGVPKDQLLRLPTDDKPETMGPIWEKVNGRPAKAEDYKLTLGEGETADPEMTKTLFAKAHELGIGTKQLDGMYTWLRETAATNIAAAKANEAADLAKATQALKTEYGAAYDQKIGDAVAAIAALEAKYPGLKIDLEKGNLGNLPSLNKFFVDFAQTMKEDGTLTGRATGSHALASPAEAMQQINALKADATFTKPYFDKSDPGHKAAVDKMAALYQQAFPGQAAA